MDLLMNWEMVQSTPLLLAARTLDIRQYFVLNFIIHTTKRKVRANI